MKRLRLILAAGLVLALTGSSPALAHTAAEDGKISGLLHIDPNDTAKAGRANTIHIYFNDLDERFTMEGCDCRIKVKQSKHILLNESLTASGIKTGVAQVFLPQDNFSYKAVVSGTPKTAGFFQPFKLKFDIDAGNPPVQLQPAEDGPNLVVRLAPAMVITGSAIGFITWRKWSRMRK